MRPSFFLFWAFVKHLGKKWILWLFLALDLLAAIIQIFFPSINLPQGVYVGATMIGLVWASFETYLDLLSRIPSEARPIQPTISIFFAEGNEYSYRFQQLGDVFSGEQLERLQVTQGDNVKETIGLPTLPFARLTLHIRIENSGVVAVNLLTVSGRIDVRQPYSFMVPTVSNPDGTPVAFPVKLEPKGLLHLHVGDPIYPDGLLTDAQIAARTRKLREDKASKEVVVFAEVIDPAGKIYDYRATHQISLMPLCNLYISHWEGLSRYDLVALATGASNANPTDEIGDDPPEHSV